MNTLKLNSGYMIPALGTGTNTFGKEGNVFVGDITHDMYMKASRFSKVED